MSKPASDAQLLGLTPDYSTPPQSLQLLSTEATYAVPLEEVEP